MLQTIFLETKHSYPIIRQKNHMLLPKVAPHFLFDVWGNIKST